MAEVRLEGHTYWDFDLDAVKPIIKGQGKLIAVIARARVSRRAISNAGEPPGKRSGTLKRTIKSKVGRKGLEVVITHVDLDDPRYPFMIVAGTKHVKAREDYIAYALDQRKSATSAALRSALVKSINPK